MVLDNFSDAFDDFETYIEPIQLKKTVTGQLESVTYKECVACGGTIPTSHRCMAKVTISAYYVTDKNDRICGRPYCLMCAEARNCPYEKHLCRFHQFESEGKMMF